MLPSITTILLVCSIVLNVRAARNARDLLRQAPRPFLESYWESYLSFPNNQTNNYLCENITDSTDHSAYCHDLASVPVAPGPGLPGLNVVNIAYANANGFTCNRRCQPIVCGLNLFLQNGIDAERIADLKADVLALQAKGAIVKLAYGGETYGNLLVQNKVTFLADSFVDTVVNAVNEFGLDGVDLDQEEGCGSVNLNCNDQSSQHLYVISELRKKLPDKIISYTFPSSLDFPFRDVAQYGHQFLDTISVYRATPVAVEALVNLGVPKEKIVWGIAIGCNGGFPSVSLADAQAVAASVKVGGFAGVMTWSVNRDTDHRLQGQGCIPEQTGLPDGSYINAISEILMS